MRSGSSRSEGVKMTATTTTPAGTAITVSGTTIVGVLVDTEAGLCRGGGVANVKAVWPGQKRATVRMFELADVEVCAG